MKPFDLEKALNGAPVVTRDGREVTHLYLFPVEGLKYPLYGVIWNERGEKSIESFTRNGLEYAEYEQNDADLFMKTEKKIGYIHPGTIANTPLGDSWIKVEYEE